MKIAIVGMGASGIITLHSLNKLYAKHLTSIDIYEEGDVSGLAYNSKQDPLFQMNGHVWNMSALEDDPDDLYAWLNTSQRSLWPEMYKSKKWRREDFCPRVLYGLYLKNIYMEAKSELANKGILVSLIKQKVTSLSVIANQYTVNNGLYQHVFLCLGRANHKTPQFLNDVNNHVRISLGMHHTQSYQQLSSVNPEETVTILGAGLSAMDACLWLLKHKPDVKKIYLVSRSGNFHPPYPETYDKEEHSHRAETLLIRNQNINLTTSLEMAFDLEIHPEVIFPILRKKILKAGNQNKKLQMEWKRLDMYRTGMPLQTYHEIQRMILSNKLEVIRGNVECVKDVGEQFQIQLNSSQILTHRIINCIGYEANKLQDYPPLIQSLIQQKILDWDESHKTFELDLNSCSPSPGLYILGPILQNIFLKNMLKGGTSQSIVGIRNQVSNAISHLLARAMKQVG